MPYVLGIDLGGTRTKAAVGRPDAPAEAVPLDGSSRWVDSVLHIGADAGVAAGQQARAMVRTDPDRVTSGFPARVGDDVALVLGGQRYTAEVLAAALAGWVTDQVAGAERAEPDRIVLTHPPGWGAHRRSVLFDALADAGMPGVTLIPAPVAAAELHLSRQPVDIGGVLAVCRIGGERSDGAVLRRTPDGFDLLAHVAGPPESAGARLDDLLVEWVGERVDEDLDPAHLRSACVLAKERLSVSDEVVVPVGRAGVRLDRAEFARIATPVLAAVIERLRRLTAAGPGPKPVAVELVGGTARIPVVADLAAEALECPAAADPDPATAICRGATLVVMPRPQQQQAGKELVTAAERVRERIDPPPRPPVELTPLVPPRRGAASLRGVLAGRRRTRGYEEDDDQ